MKITLKKELDPKADVLVYGITDKTTVSDSNLQKEISNAVKQKILSTEKFGSQYTTTVHGQKTLVISLGQEKDLTLNYLRRALGKAVKFTKSIKKTSFSSNLLSVFSLAISRNSSSIKDEEIGRSAAEGLILSNYRFTKYLSSEKKEEFPEVTEVVLQWTKEEGKVQQGIKEGSVLAECTNYTKDLVNEPACNLSPTSLENEAKKLASSKVTVKVLNKEDMKKLGMGALLGVAAGSDRPPKLIFLEYKGGSSEKYTAIIGKGITFDSGGYNLKPTKYIEDMKCDMAGSAAVLSTIKVLSTLGIKKNVLGVMACTDNLISGSAQLPGDIVTAYNGKTIEIGNTDAEGRLVLADALSYTEDKYHPEVMIDLATLTGACVVALGYEAAGMIGKDAQLMGALTLAGEKSYDRVWQLPFFEEYQDKMDGTISDLNNTSLKGKGYEAGSITAGVFLSKFVDKAKWAHLDIAGTAYILEDTDYLQKYATGSGVRILSYYLMGW